MWTPTGRKHYSYLLCVYILKHITHSVDKHWKQCWFTPTSVSIYSKTSLPTHTSGVNTRVHEGCHAEVGQDEEEDQAIVERHSGRDYLCQPGAPRDTNEWTEIRFVIVYCLSSGIYCTHCNANETLQFYPSVNHMILWSSRSIFTSLRFKLKM